MLSIESDQPAAELRFGILLLRITSLLPYFARSKTPVKPQLAIKTLLVICLAVVCVSNNSFAATFLGNSRLEVADPTGGLSWNSAGSELTVQCWFKLSIPTGTNLTENMTILSNRRGGSTNDAHAYLIEFDIFTGSVEFSTRGSAYRRFTLVERPFLERWYHVAVVRQGEDFTIYTDGRLVTLPSGPAVGDSRSTDGLAVGGWNANGSQGRSLWGEVQEVSIYQSALSPDFIVQYLFTNQPSVAALEGYFKLAYATNAASTLTNFAPAPVPAGTESAAKIGGVEFEETSQSGEQSAFDAQRNGGRDAITPLSGAFSWGQTVFSRPTPGVALDFRIGYSSANAFGGFKLGGTDPYASGPLGKGWRHTFETRIVRADQFSPLADTDTLGLMLWNGAIETWDLDLDLGEYRPREQSYKGELLLTSTNCQWITPERLVYVFRRPQTGPAVMRGRLTEIRDFNGNRVRVQWDEIFGRITNVIDSAGGKYSFDTNSLIRSVAFGAWQVNFNYDATNRLISKSITNTSGLYVAVNTTWQFAYNASNGLLQAIIDPRGLTNQLVQYDKYGRKTNEVDALGRATQTRYGVPGKRQITHLDPGTNSWVETYDRKGRILVQREPLGNETRHTYDDAGNRTSLTEPLGWKTLFAYDSRANVIARTNALGEVTRWSFHSFFNKATNEINPLGWTNRYVLDNSTGNLLRHFDDFGTLVSYTYASNGLVLTSTDANTNTARFAYDTNGFLISRTDPATNTTTFAYNDVGWKISELDPLYNWTDYDHDLNGNVVEMTDPLFRRFYKMFDGRGNLLATSDAKERFTTNFFDAANQKVATTDRTGTNTTRFAYTSRGKLERVTNALGHVTRYFYDAANRLTNATDALGNSTLTEYDANGNAFAMMDAVGQRWTKTFDRLNRVIAESDPLGNTRQTTYDAAGRIRQVTTPNGHPSLHGYDGRGRLTNWVDAENFSWKYTYDGNANIIDIEDALHGHYVMSYGPRNERLSELNQDTNLWRYTYDELLRLAEQRDPNGTVRTMQYDEASRVDRVDFNTGRYHTFAYDDNNNLEVVTRRDGASPPVPTRFRYDVLDRPIEQSDVHYQTVNYGYDALGRNISKTYPGGKMLAQSFDPLSRLTNQLFDFGPQKFTNSYAYDQASRLVQRRYPNGVIQSNAFDTAGRITNLTYAALNFQPSTFNLALTYAYDRNGNKTASTEKGTLDWPLPPLTDEIANYTAAGKLKTRAISNTPTNAMPSLGGEGQGEGGIFSYHYDLSGNMTNAVLAGGVGTNVQSWALTYDEDNRTKSLRWTTNAQTHTVSNRYDALGRRVSRTLNGSETRYVLDLSGGMERILCDMNVAGVITAWYVHGPDLAFKVDASGHLTCYHADAQANIIALTGPNGTNLALYAYTPYGRVLGASNLLSTIGDQPYRFVGSQGVMEDLPGIIFMRARYYSAEAGVFLSTDPVKKIGPGWKSDAFAYANGNPNGNIDPNGNIAVPAFFLGAAVGMAKGFASELIVQGASALSSGRFDWDEIVISMAAEGLGEGAAFATGNAAIGGAVSDVYRGYINALSKGEGSDYFLKQGPIDAFTGGAKSLAFEKYVSKVSLGGGNYPGAVRGPNASTLTGAFSGSHFFNGLTETVFNTSKKATDNVRGNSYLPNGNNGGGSGGLSGTTPDAGRYGGAITDMGMTPGAGPGNSGSTSGGSGGGFNLSLGGNINLGLNNRNPRTGGANTPAVLPPPASPAGNTGFLSGLRNFFRGLFR